MKLIGVKEFYNITRAKVISALNCAIVVAVCSTATFIVDSALDYNTVQAQPVATEVEVTVTVVSTPDETAPDETDPAETSATEITESSAETSPSETSASSESSESSSEETSDSTPTPSPAPEETTGSTTAETTERITEKELYLAVYATTTINVRKGPGTDDDVVKSVYAGDQIDVIAVTSNGWYKTYNGNYVKKSLTTETKPTATPSPKPKPTAKPTSKPASTTKSTESQKPASGETHNCKITFYGPQPTANGGYSKSTATGTTCVEGQTCAADWSIYPPGTVIYIANDPLGGDGYYTVEDKGGGVKGYHIDIYAEDGESGNHSTCWRDVTSQ